MSTGSLRKSLFALAVLSAAPAIAEVTGVTGGIVVIEPPSSVVLGALESDSQMFLFRERTSFALTAPVQVDVTSAGSVGVAGDLGPGSFIPEGTVVDSYYLHHDQLGDVRNYNAGTVTFDTEVLGIVVLVQSLLNSDAQLGSPATTYNTEGQAQGLELTVGCKSDVVPGVQFQDAVTLSDNLLEVSVCTNVYAFPDDIRIITRSRIPVVIDIKPGSFPNSINTKNKGVIPVAILGDGGVDLTQVDLDTVRFSGAGPSHAASEDVNGDGIPDLIMQFVTAETSLKLGDTTACLTGKLVDKQPFIGCDSVRIVK